MRDQYDMGGDHKYVGQRYHRGLQSHISDEKLRRQTEAENNDGHTVWWLSALFTEMTEAGLTQVRLMGGDGLWTKQKFFAGKKEWTFGLLSAHRLTDLLRVLKDRYPEITVTHTPVRLLGVTLFKDRYTLELPEPLLWG